MRCAFFGNGSRIYYSKELNNKYKRNNKIEDAFVKKIFFI